MNAGYQIFMFLFIFGVMCGAVNELGIWSHKLPNTQYTITQENITTTVTDAQDTPMNFFTVYELVMKFLRVIVTGFLACFSVALVFYGMGFDIPIVGAILLQCIQIPCSLVMLFWFYEQFTGRQVE